VYNVTNNNNKIRDRHLRDRTRVLECASVERPTMLALRRMGPVYVMGQRTGSSLGFLSTATGADVLSIASVPLGSELSLRFDDSLVDVRVVNGSAEDLSIEAEGGCSAAIQTEPINAPLMDRIRYVVTLTGAEGRGARPRVRAGIPPRYFGLEIETGGNVELLGSIKEARHVSISTHGGKVALKAGLSAETVVLLSGGGSVQAAEVTASEAMVDTRRSRAGAARATDDGREERPEDGAVDIRRASCLRFDAHGGDVRIESLISSSTEICGATINVSNANTLEGEAVFRLRTGDSSPGLVRLGGVDGKIGVDDGGRAAFVEMQLNRNARRVEYRASPDTEVRCYKVPELRIVEGDGDRDGEGPTMGLEPVCHVIGTKGHDKLTVIDRSWRASFMERKDH
jgi:hypothetical protein